MIRATGSKPIDQTIARTAALALAVSGLAGCAERSSEAGVAAEAERLAVYGVPGVYGDRAAEAPGNSILRRSMPFGPKYYAVVYLKFENGGHLRARHAYFLTNKPDDIPCAIDYLKSGTAGSNCEPYDEDPLDAVKPIIFEDFDHFTFGSQQRVYVYVDNEEVAFNDVEPVSFTPFGAFDPPAPVGSETRHSNLSFYNADARTLGSSTRNGLLYIENYYRAKDGGALPDSYDGANNALYSMNFNLLMCKGGRKCDFSEGQVIPIAIDPDTGNGWGSKP